MEIDIESIKKLNLKRGEYIIAKLSRYCTYNQYRAILHRLEHTFKEDIDKKGVKILLLEPDLEIVKLDVIEKDC